jgi:hypothetical protein
MTSISSISTPLKVVLISVILYVLSTCSGRSLRRAPPVMAPPSPARLYAESVILASKCSDQLDNSLRALTCSPVKLARQLLPLLVSPLCLHLKHHALFFSALLGFALPASLSPLHRHLQTRPTTLRQH